MALTFLFWNLQKAPLEHRVARMVALHDVDVLILAECAARPDDLIATLRAVSGVPPFHVPPHAGRKIQIFSRLPEESMVTQFDDAIGAVTVRRMRVGNAEPFLLAAVHLPSKQDWDRDDQTLGVAAIASDVQRVEEKVGYHRTLLVGDLNMNPFDPGVSGAGGFHATMSLRVARRGERLVQGRRHRLFYNPMWGLLGDRTAGPSGTFFLHSSKPNNYFWNTYDQLLVRPELADRLTDLRVLDSDGEATLLTRNGLPDKRRGSDHLPLLFRLEV